MDSSTTPMALAPGRSILETMDQAWRRLALDVRAAAARSETHAESASVSGALAARRWADAAWAVRPGLR